MHRVYHLTRVCCGCFFVIVVVVVATGPVATRYGGKLERRRQRPNARRPTLFNMSQFIR